ncbi:MAG: hypothetical protein JKY37_21245 [Nannocystaceae bacterium]|nr:hypothetical protein [Nannocystaceae bacterium]
MLKADGTIRSRRATPKRAPRKLPDPVPLASARYVAVEIETSRAPGPKCTRTTEQAAGVVNGQDMVKVTSTTIDPVFISTEFKLVDLTNGKELGRKSFPPNATACRDNVYPDSVETSGWVGNLIAEHNRGGAK